MHTGYAWHGKEREEFYRLHSLWCIHLYEYEATLLIEDQAYPLHPGSITLLPPQTSMQYCFKGYHPHTFVHFTLDGYDAAHAPAPLWLPARCLSDETRGYFGQVTNAWLVEKARAVALLWVLLWRVAAEAQAARSSPPEYPALSKALDFMERNLSSPLQVGEVAEHCELSLQRLNHHARQHYGCSLGVFLRRRKMERARHLLEQSDLAVKVVAAEVGMPDLHQFNKFFKHYAGMAPSAYRAKKKGAAEK